MTNTEKLKKHFKKYKVPYAVGGTAIGVAGITYLIMRRNALQHISRGIPVATQGGIPVLGENVVTNIDSHFLIGTSRILNTVNYITADRQGPASWVVRCIETGNIFPSQNAAALAMELPASEISKHLNGVLDVVRGFTFERICMAAT